MNLSERIALIRAGYTKKEIADIIAEESKENLSEPKEEVKSPKAEEPKNPAEGIPNRPDELKDQVTEAAPAEAEIDYKLLAEQLQLKLDEAQQANVHQDYSGDKVEDPESILENFFNN